MVEIVMGQLSELIFRMAPNNVVRLLATALILFFLRLSSFPTHLNFYPLSNIDFLNYIK